MASEDHASAARTVDESGRYDRLLVSSDPKIRHLKPYRYSHLVVKTEPAMIVSNRRRRAIVLIAIIALAVTALLAAFVIHRNTTVHERSVLAPDPVVVRYRFSTTTTVRATSADTASTIKALEARLAQLPSPFDTAELADLYFRRAQEAGDVRDYRTAEAMARRSLELMPSPNSAVLTLAKVANSRHQFREAIQFARQAKLQSSATQIVLATAHLALGELVPAAEAANTAVALKPDVNSYSMRALVFQAQGRDAEAVFDFASAARLEESGDVTAAARTRALWGRLLLRRGELAGAALVFEEALRIAPGFPLALELRGELELRQGRAKQARALFEQAFAASRQVRYLIDQARAQELAGDRAGADALRAQVESIVRAELTDGGFGHRLDLIEVLVDRGNTNQLAEAVTLATEEVSHRGSFEARFQLARALARSGRGDDAMVQVQAALASGAREAQLYELASRLEQRRGNLARATLYRTLADELDPGASGWRALGLDP